MVAISMRYRLSISKEENAWNKSAGRAKSETIRLAPATEVSVSVLDRCKRNPSMNKRRMGSIEYIAILPVFENLPKQYHA